jgi:signal-transduction protein with cAMP-binding, CBS, and nucleotidyltransferase domain
MSAAWREMTMNLGELCTRPAVTCEPHFAASDLARLMRKHHVGDLVVVSTTSDGVRPLGMVTDRDLVMQVMAPGVDPQLVTAADLMSPSTAAFASETAYDAIWHMRRKGCRRLPVVDAHGCLVGVVTLDDLTRFLANEFVELGRLSQRQLDVESARLPALP